MPKWSVHGATIAGLCTINMIMLGVLGGLQLGDKHKP